MTFNALKLQLWDSGSDNAWPLPCLPRMWTVSSTTPRMATAHRSVWGSPSSVAVARATRRHRAWDTIPSTSTLLSPLRSCARFKARVCVYQSATPNIALFWLSWPFFIPIPYTKGSTACFKLFSFRFFPPYLSDCVIQFFSIHLYFWTKSTFVVFLMLNICTFVYMLSRYFFSIVWLT